MLSREDNELLCRVGPGTPAGETLRRYWLPVLFSDEINSAVSSAVRASRVFWFVELAIETSWSVLSFR